MPTLKIQKADGTFEFLQLAGEEFADIGNQVLDVKSQLAQTVELSNDIPMVENDLVAPIGYRHKVNIDDVMKIAPINGLQGAFNAMPRNTEVYFSKIYETNEPVAISKPGIRLISTLPHTDNAGAGIHNKGSGVGLQISNQKVEVIGLNVKADNSHGIEISGGERVILERVTTNNCGGHGIHVTNNAWVIHLNHCFSEYNALDGVNSVSEGEGTFQNGNNLIVNGGVYSSNGRHGLSLRAAQMAVYGANIESNLQSGIRVDMTGGLVFSQALSFHDNYIENNFGAQIHITGRTLAPIIGLVIENNLFNTSRTSGAKELIKIDGDLDSIRYAKIGINRYSIIGSYVTHHVVSNSALASDSKIYVLGDGNENSRYTITGQVEIVKFGTKHKNLSGYVGQKGIAWSAPNRSDIISANVTSHFHLDLPHRALIQRVRSFIRTDATNYSVIVKLQRKYVLTSAVMETVTTFTSNNINGDLNMNHLFVNNGNFRIEKDYTYFISVEINGTNFGTFMYLNDLQIEYV